MSSIPAAATRSSVELALGGRSRDIRGRAFSGVLLLALLLSLAILFTLLVSIWNDAWPVFRERGFDFLTSETSSLPERAGVRQGLVGSLILIALVAVISLPLGIAAAIYLQEYAKDTRLRRILVANIRNLAGVPSIVYGILGLVVFVQALRSVTGGASYGRSYLSGGLTLAVLVMPFVVIIAMEALRAVPWSIREAAYGVGATKWEVIRSHVLPYAAPGMYTGVILGLARAFGETAPLLLAGAVTGFLATSPGGPWETLQGLYTALPVQVFAWSRLPGQAWVENTAAAIIVLLATILIVNLVVIVLRTRYERTW
jgi:phosphate transport system permease protein